jgi:hypothetical protein
LEFSLDLRGGGGRGAAADAVESPNRFFFAEGVLFEIALISLSSWLAWSLAEDVKYRVLFWSVLYAGVRESG